MTPNSLIFFFISTASNFIKYPISDVPSIREKVYVTLAGMWQGWPSYTHLTEMITEAQSVYDVRVDKDKGCTF